MASYLPLCDTLRVRSKLLSAVYRPCLTQPCLLLGPFLTLSSHFLQPPFLFQTVRHRPPSSGDLHLLFPLPKTLLPRAYWRVHSSSFRSWLKWSPLLRTPLPHNIPSEGVLHTGLCWSLSSFLSLIAPAVIVSEGLSSFSHSCCISSICDQTWHMGQLHKYLLQEPKHTSLLL